MLFRSEEVFVGDISSGAKQDIERTTQLARSMVCEWGMSNLLGTVTYDERSENNQYFGAGTVREKMYSEKTAQEIDAEVRRIIDEAYQHALKLIREHKDAVELMTQMLIEFETLDNEDVQRIIKGEWNPDEKRSKLTRLQTSHTKTEQTPPPPPPLPADDEHIIDQKPLEMST